MKTLKIIFTDIVGVLLLIAALLLGWIPGPGGIPLLIAGLSLLAINHKWARNILTSVKDNGVKLMDIFFNEHRGLMIFFDIFSLLIIVGGVYVLTAVTKQFWQSLAIAVIFIGLGIFLGNRKRLQKIVSYFKK